MECKVEEDLLQIPGLMVSQGYVGKFKCCTDARVTTARVIYTCHGVHRTIPLSSIIECQLKRTVFHQVIRLKCTDELYHLRWDDGIEQLHQVLVDALEHYTVCNVIECSESIGGISRWKKMKQERMESVNQLKRSALLDIRKLKQMSKRLIEVAKQLKAQENPLSDTLNALQIPDLLEETIPQESDHEVEQLMHTLMKRTGLVLLRDLFCLVNRMRLCNFITPDKLKQEVESLQEKGVCKIMDMDGITIILSNDWLASSDKIMSIVAKGPITLIQFAEMVDVSIPTAESMLLYAQLEGLITRDDGEDVTYYHNPFIL